MRRGEATPMVKTLNRRNLEHFGKIRKILSLIPCADSAADHPNVTSCNGADEEADVMTNFRLLGALAILLGWVSVAAAREPLVFIGSDTFETTILGSSHDLCKIVR
jgi:hypothetical protein